MSFQELLLPRTDAGVVAQLALLVAATAASWVALRGERELRVFALGLAFLLAMLAGLRALH